MNEYKICEVCEQQNAVSALECSCGADLSFVPPTILTVPIVNQQISPTTNTLEVGNRTAVFHSIKLVSKKDGFEVEIPIEGGSIGREGSLCKNYFADNLWVSNYHARIYNNGRSHIIVDERSTNGSKLNGVKLEKGKEYTLLEGDRIMVASMEFLVKKSS